MTNIRQHSPSFAPTGLGSHDVLCTFNEQVIVMLFVCSGKCQQAFQQQHSSGQGKWQLLLFVALVTIESIELFDVGAGVPWVRSAGHDEAPGSRHDAADSAALLQL